MKTTATLPFALAVTLGAAAAHADPAPVAAYLPLHDALQLPYTDWQLPYDTGMPLLAAAPPYMSPVPPGACQSAAPSTAATTPAPASSSRYPRAELDRPAIMPLGVAVASLDARAVPSTGVHAEHVAATPGLIAGLPYASEVRLSYAQPLGGDGGPSWLAGSTGMRLWGNSALVVSTRSTLTFDAGAGAWGTSTSGVRVAAVVGRVGVVLQPEQVTFDLAGDTAPQLALPVAAGVQVTPTLWMHAQATFRIAELVDERLVRRDPRPLPVGLAAVASVAPKLDLRAGVSGDVGGDGVITSSVGWSLGLAYIFGG